MLQKATQKCIFTVTVKPQIVFVETQFVYYNIIGFIRESRSAYALSQNLLETLSNSLSMKLKLCGGQKKVVQNKKYFACLLLRLLLIFLTS